MSTQPQRCVACGYVGYDVGPRLVRIDPIETALVHGYVVPVAFQVQIRCVDKYACEERQEKGNEK